MGEKKTLQISEKVYKLYLEQKHFFETFQKVEEITKASAELGEIEYVNPYLSSTIQKSNVSGEYYAS